MKKDLKEYKDPELFIDGQKIKFHSSRSERLARKKTSSIKYNEPFFSKKNRYLHIMILNIIIIFIMGIIISTIYGNSKSFNEDGFYFSLTKRNTFSKNELYFIFLIKNVLKKDNLLKYPDYYFILYDEKDIIIYQKNNLILKQVFKPEEKYTDVFLVMRPKNGKYRAVIVFNNNIKINMNFQLQ
ncbi:MAG: hypothetical protein JXB50_16135 [Spirochaetes bacterium]|nr:hypothetical protein [Spirochaetota bacterium]